MSSASGSQTPSTLAPDRSLTPDEYFALGMPAVSRPWQGDDLAKAQQVIGKLAEENPLALPRRSSPVSGGVFARITASENYALASYQYIPLQIRLQIIEREIKPLVQMSGA